MLSPGGGNKVGKNPFQAGPVKLPVCVNEIRVFAVMGMFGDEKRSTDKSETQSLGTAVIFNILLFPAKKIAAVFGCGRPLQSGALS